MKNILLLFLLTMLFFSCKKDPCADTVCENGGTCIDGQCLCEGLWKGKYCTEQVTPILITVGSISIVQMPQTDANGAGWDINSGPDVYVIVKQFGNVLLSTENQWIQNATVGSAFLVPFAITDAESPITVELWDYDDFDSNDFMGSVQGTIYDNTNGFPSTVITTCNACNVNFQFSNITYL